MNSAAHCAISTERAHASAVVQSSTTWFEGQPILDHISDQLHLAQEALLVSRPEDVKQLIRYQRHAAAVFRLSYRSADKMHYKDSDREAVVDFIQRRVHFERETSRVAFYQRSNCSRNWLKYRSGSVRGNCETSLRLVWSIQLLLSGGQMFPKKLL